MRAALVDVSRYQGRTNGKAIKDAGFIGIVARCTIGWGYRDQWYANNLAQAHDNDLIFGAYHVLWPENRDPKREAAHFADNISPPGYESPDLIVADLERMGGRSASEVANQIEVLMPALEQEVGLHPLIYTGSWFWNSPTLLGPATPIGVEADYELWEADYLRPPFIPGYWRPNQAPQENSPYKPSPGKGWTDWAIWQWTSKGQKIGVESASLDYDVYNGTEAEFREWLGLGNPNPPPTMVEKVDLLWEAHPELHP